MPGMVDPNSWHADPISATTASRGALGVVINRPIDLDLSTLFEQIGLPLPERLHRNMVYFGGPVQTERRFCAAHGPAAHLQFPPSPSTTRQPHHLEGCAGSGEPGRGPEKFWVSLGLRGLVGPGQLEDELKQNAWLSVFSRPRR